MQAWEMVHLGLGSGRVQEDVPHGELGNRFSGLGWQQGSPGLGQFCGGNGPITAHFMLRADVIEAPSSGLGREAPDWQS